MRSDAIAACICSIVSLAPMLLSRLQVAHGVFPAAHSDDPSETGSPPILPLAGEEAVVTVIEQAEAVCRDWAEAA
jgi:hypothetical protein